MEEQQKKEEFRPSWPYFLFFGILSVLSFYYSIWWGGLMFGAGALLCFPNKNAHAWIIQQISNIKQLIVSFLYLALVLLLIGVFVWFVGKIFNGIGNLGKYEGQTAKEWYYDYAYSEDRYQKFRNCVEDYDSLDIRTQLNYGGVLNYCE